MAENGNGGLRLTPTALAMVIGLLGQAAGLVIWATNEHNARVALQDRVRELEMRATDLNKAQDERTARLDDFIRSYNNQQTVTNTTTNSRIDNINGHLTRMDDRIQRVVEALDSFYKQFVDHIKEHK